MPETKVKKKVKDVSSMNRQRVLRQIYAENELIPITVWVKKDSQTIIDTIKGFDLKKDYAPKPIGRPKKIEG